MHLPQQSNIMFMFGFAKPKHEHFIFTSVSLGLIGNLNIAEAVAVRPGDCMYEYSVYVCLIREHKWYDIL